MTEKINDRRSVGAPSIVSVKLNVKHFLPLVGINVESDRLISIETTVIDDKLPIFQF